MDTKDTKADAGPLLPDSCTPEFEAIISSLGHTLQGTGTIETQKAFNEHMDSVEEGLEEKFDKLKATRTCLFRFYML